MDIFHSLEEQLLLKLLKQYEEMDPFLFSKEQFCRNS